MTADDKRPHLFRRLFHRKSASSEADSSRGLLLGPKTLNATAAETQGNESSSTGKSGGGQKYVGSGLWNEVYDSFAASAASSDLRAVAKLLREQSTHSSSLKTMNSDSHLEASREWNLCREILQMAETKIAELENTTEKHTIRQIRHAYKEIITWTQKFVAMGDIISQVDPLHIGLPWAGVRAVLIVRCSSPIQVRFYSHWLLLRSPSMIRPHKPKSLPGLHISRS